MKTFMTIFLTMCAGTGSLLSASGDENNQAFSLLSESPPASVFYLDNGMEVVLVENHASPMIAAFTIVKTGSRNEDEATNGAAHFLEHLLFNGTKKRTQQQIYDEMDFYGGYNNAHTGPDYTNFMILMPKEYIAEGMDIQADMLFNSTLPMEKFEKERGIVIEEIGRDADRPTYQVDNHFLRTFYAGTPYERPVLGTVSTISHMQRDGVMAYYRTWYVPNNMTLMVIGDFSTPEMVELVGEKYGSYPPGTLPQRQPVQLAPRMKRQIVRATGMGTFPTDRRYLTMGYVLPSPASEAFQALELLTEFLGGKETSILKTLFKDEAYTDLVNTISADLQFNRDFSTLQISAELPLESDADGVVELITQAVKEMAENPVSADELRSSLVARATQEIYLLDKLHYYPMMKSAYLTAGGYAFLRDYMEKLIQVTPQSIQDAADQYLRPQAPVVTLMSPPRRTADSAADASSSRYHTETLENGLTVTIKQSQGSRVVGIHLLARERSLSEGKGAWGMTEILQRMLLEGGTASHPGEALYQAFESIGAEVKLHDNPYIPYDNYYSSPRFAYIRLKLVDTFFEKGLGLLAEMISQPQLTEAAFEQAKKEVVPLSANAALSTPRVGTRLLYDNLFVKNPGFGWTIGEAEQLEAIQLETVKTFYRKFYNPANLILAISGSEPIEPVMAKVKRYFADNWGEIGWKPPVFTPQFAGLGKVIRETVGKQQSYLYITNRFVVEKKDRPALLILQNLFSDRLALNLREKQGLAYSIGMGTHRYGDAHWYTITMGTRPENIETAIEGIHDEIRAMRENPVEMDEVRQTINAALGRRGMRRLDRVSQAYYIGMHLFDGEPPEADEQFGEDLKGVTAADIERLARQVFHHDDHLTVIVE